MARVSKAPYRLDPIPTYGSWNPGPWIKRRVTAGPTHSHATVKLQQKDIFDGEPAKSGNDVHLPGRSIRSAVALITFSERNIAVVWCQLWRIPKGEPASSACSTENRFGLPRSRTPARSVWPLALTLPGARLKR
jgi:hypothetical protein